ncbi:hypothetical protein AB0M36_09755 [Actinoplanes sp. NPDC051346]|uniref:hypothetical protein n=1 Tax=Actinoplanes sp. NPDC051346 TaxID=3155048 RepID=UPI003425968C
MSGTPLSRPTLLPGLLRTWHGSSTLQLGFRPPRAVLIDLPNPATARLLTLLDGSRSQREVLRRAARLGAPPAEAEALLDSLSRAGLVVSAHTLYPSGSDAEQLSGEAAALVLAPDPTRPPAGPSFVPDLIDAPTGPPPSTDRAAPPPGQPPIPGQAGTPASTPPNPHPARTPANPPPNPHPARTPANPPPNPDPARTPASSPPAKSDTERPAVPSPITDLTGLASPVGADTTAAAVLRRRRAARIVIRGRGRLAAGIAVGLAESGIGHVHADLSGAVTRQDRIAGPLRDSAVGTPRSAAVTAAILRAVPATGTGAIRRGVADLVVQLDYDQPVALLAAGYGQRRQPHLAVAIREAAVVIGPLVPAIGGPCLNCLDLHRHDRNPDAARPSPDPRDGEPCAAVTVLTATAYAVAQVLDFVDGQVPASRGAEIEIGAPGRLRRRSWASHPCCFCVGSRGGPARGGRTPPRRAQ